MSAPRGVFFFFFNDTATTEIYTLSLHDALPIFDFDRLRAINRQLAVFGQNDGDWFALERSEEHTSELQSQSNLVCRLLLEKKKRSRLNGDLPFPDDNLYTIRNALNVHIRKRHRA